jgi:hypothetical protein
MKNAKKVLFVMIVSAPLSMFGMEDRPVTPPASPRNLVDNNSAAAITPPASPTSSKNSEFQIDLNASSQNPHACKAKRLATTSVLLGLTTGLSFVAQAYDKSGVTRDPKFVQAQYAAVAATATTAVLAAHQAHKAHPEFVNNAVDTTTTSVQNAATYVKNLCACSKADDAN